MKPINSNQADNFEAVKAALYKILKPYEKKLVLTGSASDSYSLNTRHVLPNKQSLFFASFQLRKGYVSFYLMPVYVFPDLLKGISPTLRKRMQGKSCFNFKEVDPVLFKELTALTKAGYERYKQAGMLK